MLTSFFDLANTVVSTVQARTNELVTSVKETDWASEIEAFKKELQEDTQQVVHTVEHSLETLPEHVRVVFCLEEWFDEGLCYKGVLGVVLGLS